MNIAVIFAGGVGQRMKTANRPKQFLEMHKKPIIIYSLEIFEQHPDVDAIVVACVKEWIPYLKELLEKFHITKVKNYIKIICPKYYRLMNLSLLNLLMEP